MACGARFGDCCDAPITPFRDDDDINGGDKGGNNNGGAVCTRLMLPDAGAGLLL